MRNIIRLKKDEGVNEISREMVGWIKWTRPVISHLPVTGLEYVLNLEMSSYGYELETGLPEVIFFVMMGEFKFEDLSIVLRRMES